MRGLLALLASFALLLAPACTRAGPLRMHGQAVSNACSGAPVGVIALGLCDQLLLKSTNGPRTATVNVSVYPSLPAGWSYSGGALTSDITGTGTNVTGIDNALKGGFYYSGNGTHTLTDFSLTSNSAVTHSGFPLGIGVTSGGAITGVTNVDFEHGTIDGVGMDFAVSVMVQAHGLGTTKFGFVNFIHPARDQFITNDPGGTIIFDHPYFDVPCQSAAALDHCEPTHFQSGGTISIDGGYENMSDGTQSPGAGNSGAIQAQTGVGSDFAAYTGGAMTLNVGTTKGNIFNYGCVINQALLSLKAVFADITANVKNNAVCPPMSAANHVLVTQADIGITSVVGTFANNDTLTAAGGKSATLLCSPAPTCVSNLHLSSWGTGAHFTVGDVITGSPSGATAVATSSIFYHAITLNDLGGNLNYDGTAYTP